MITNDAFMRAMRSRGIEMVTGVPCAYLGGPIACLTEAEEYVPAANEGAALALAAGAVVTGRRAAVLAQNSGLGNLINPLTSLVMPYRIPVLIMLSLRGWPDSDKDEPQHAVMGTTTHRLLDTLGVWHATLPEGCTDLQRPLSAAAAALAIGQPAFLLVPKGSFAKASGSVADYSAMPRASRRSSISAVLGAFPGSTVIATTGFTSRELFALQDSGRHFYMQGSMGHATAFGLAVAISRPDLQRVVILDGDGAALMHMGSMSTIGACAPTNLIHVLLDNGVYDSTGGQPSKSEQTSFADVGAAVGYRTASVCGDLDALAAALAAAKAIAGPHLVVVATKPNRVAPPRATSSISAPQIHHRFTAAMGATSAWANIDA